MIDAITAAQIAMNQDQKRLERINQNISNMQIPGYKRQLLEEQFSIDSSKNSLIQLFTQGRLNQTKIQTDLALIGDGFFTVQNAKGIFYTRRGDLQVNDQGELTTQAGDLILGKSGAIKVDDQFFTIDSKGIIYLNNQKIDELNLVQFDSNQTLQYRGQGLYEAFDLPKPLDNSTKVLQGYIEQSNANSLDEMLELVKISRHFEASQRVLRFADSLMSFAINQLGEENV